MKFNASWLEKLIVTRPPRKGRALLPFALHVSSCSVPIEHGVVGGFLDRSAVELDGLSPLLASKSLIGLQLNLLQIGR